MIRADGTQSWWQNHQLHRVDGPAVTRADGTQEWWMHSVDRTREIQQWIQSNQVTWPWDHDTQTQFVLTWY